MPGKDFDKGAKIREAHHLAQVSLPNLGRGRDVANHLQSRFRRSAIGRENVYFAVVHHVDLHAGGFDNAADLLAAGPDQVANLVGGNVAA